MVVLGQKVYAVKLYSWRSGRVSFNLDYGTITRADLKDDKITYRIGDSVSDFAEEELFLTEQEVREKIEAAFKEIEKIKGENENV